MYIPKELIVLDLETTGAHPLNNEIIEVGAVKVVGGKIVDTFSSLVCPETKIPEYITGLTGITNAMVAQEPTIEVVLPQFLKFCGGEVIVGHNVNLFDYRMIKAKAIKYGYPFEKSGIDTLPIARKCLPQLPSRKLGDLCDYYKIDLKSAHRAFHDARATYELLMHLYNDYYPHHPELFSPHKLEWKVPKMSPITMKQESFLSYLLGTHHLVLDGDIKSLSKSEASKKIDKIIREYGR